MLKNVKKWTVKQLDAYIAKHKIPMPKVKGTLLKRHKVAAVEKYMTKSSLKTKRSLSKSPKSSPKSSPKTSPKSSPKTSPRSLPKKSKGLPKDWTIPQLKLFLRNNRIPFPKSGSGNGKRVVKRDIVKLVENFLAKETDESSSTETSKESISSTESSASEEEKSETSAQSSDEPHLDDEPHKEFMSKIQEKIDDTIADAFFQIESSALVDKIADRVFDLVMPRIKECVMKLIKESSKESLPKYDEEFKRLGFPKVEIFTTKVVMADSGEIILGELLKSKGITEDDIKSMLDKEEGAFGEIVIEVVDGKVHIIEDQRISFKTLKPSGPPSLPKKIKEDYLSEKSREGGALYPSEVEKMIEEKLLKESKRLTKDEEGMEIEEKKETLWENGKKVEKGLTDDEEEDGVDNVIEDEESDLGLSEVEGEELEEEKEQRMSILKKGSEEEVVLISSEKEVDIVKTTEKAIEETQKEEPKVDRETLKKFLTDVLNDDGEIDLNLRTSTSFLFSHIEKLENLLKIYPKVKEEVLEERRAKQKRVTFVGRRKKVMKARGD